MALGFASQTFFDRAVDFGSTPIHIRIHGVPIDFFFCRQIIVYNRKLKAFYPLADKQHVVLLYVKNQKNDKIGGNKNAGQKQAPNRVGKNE